MTWTLSPCSVGWLLARRFPPIFVGAPSLLACSTAPAAIGWQRKYCVRTSIRLLPSRAIWDETFPQLKTRLQFRHISVIHGRSDNLRILRHPARVHGDLTAHRRRPHRVDARVRRAYPVPGRNGSIPGACAKWRCAARARHRTPVGVAMSGWAPAGLRRWQRPGAACRA